MLVKGRTRTEMNSEETELVGISIGDARLAALFCNRIVDVSNEHAHIPDCFRVPGVEDIVFDAYSEVATTVSDAEVEENRDTAFYSRFKNSRAVYLQDKLSKIGIRSAPFFVDGGVFDGFRATGGYDAIVVEITNAPIVSVEDVSWEQIVELRADPDFRKKLASFRLFLAGEYSKKDIAYVQESLNAKLEAYEAVVRRNGLTFRLGTYKQVLSSKSLMGALGVATLGALMGLPAASIPALAGVAVELGKLAIRLVERRVELEEFNANHPIAYLMDVRNLASRDSSGSG